MALENAWILLICVGLSVALTGGFWLLRKNKEAKAGKTFLFANTSRLTRSSAYNNALKAYKFGVFAIVGTLLLATVSVGVIAAKPVAIKTESPIKYNRDIVLCLDVSGSMIYVDAELVKKFKTLADGFQGERISLVVFNSVSNQVFPLTDDYEYIQTQFDRVLTGLNGDTVNGYDIVSYTVNADGASLIGDGLAACSMTFDESNSEEKRSKSIILATDNVVNGEELISLQDSANLATKNGVTVYGINPEDPTAPEETRKLEEAVKSTGGDYFALSDPNAVSGIVDRISSEETSAIQGEDVITKTDIPQGWIFLAGFTLISCMVLAWKFKV